MMKMLCILIAVVVPQMYTPVKTHWFVHNNGWQLTVLSYNKVDFKKKGSEAYLKEAQLTKYWAIWALE